MTWRCTIFLPCEVPEQRKPREIRIFAIDWMDVDLLVTGKSGQQQNWSKSSSVTKQRTVIDFYQTYTVTVESIHHQYLSPVKLLTALMDLFTCKSDHCTVKSSDHVCFVFAKI